MGVLLAIAMVVMVVSAGPASMNAKPARLPAATVAGGGSVNGIPMPARAGATAIDAAKSAAPNATAKASKVAAPQAAKATAPAAAHPRAARMLRVGSARLNPRVRAGGIPSPAAAANLAIAGGGRVASNQTGAVRMGGIPSPAASEQLGPQKLPFRPSDGVTLPRATGERDGHAVDTHYGAATLPMEEAAAPAMTPGASAAKAERQVSINQVSGGSGSPVAPPSGGPALAF
jgi:hypothetical protein